MNHKKIRNRLRRIEGQVRGIETMVEKNRSENEIIIQLEAVKSSLQSAIREIVSSSLKKDDKKIILTKEQAKIILKYIK